MRPSLAGTSTASLGVAILLAALSSAVYRSFVFSQFVPIRIGVMDAEQTASRRVVTMPLPDVTSLRDHTAVLALRLRNDSSERKRIGLLRDGVQAHRVELPPDGTISWDIVLSPEDVQALGTETGDAMRSLELTGDANGWSVTACEIRNYHARWGDRMRAVILPRDADRYISTAAFVPITIALCGLAFANALIRAKPQTRSFRLVGDGIALTAVLVCLTCLVLPRISPYTLLLSVPAFLLVTSGLFSAVLLYLFYAAPKILASISSMLRTSPAAVTRGWKRHEVTFERAAALLGLAAIAIAQPIFEVVSNSPEFFPARSTPPATAVGAVLAICLGVPLALLAIERAIQTVNVRAATTFHGMTVALLSAALVMPWFRRGEVLVLPWDILVSALAGCGVALACIRIRIVRQFLTALAPAAVVVPSLFLLDPRIKQNLLGSESAAALQSVERTPPIILIVFDELPMNSLLDGGGNIDAERYPNFGALAREASWFRNASTVAYTTSDALPAIVSGRYVTSAEAVPTLRYYPVNVFTALARHYNIFASMRFQQLCPPRACRQNAAIPADSVPSLLSDLGLVWLHIVLPQKLTEELPPVVGDWAEFGRTREAATATGRTGRRAEFAEFVSAIDGQPARLHFLHILLPHMPFEYVPSGRQYRAPDHQNVRYRGSLLFEKASAAFADTIHQRHLAQVGYADRLIGDLIARLREAGAWDKALIIITADHGASYREGRFRRQPRPPLHNLSDILQVPLLVKLPGQQRGGVVDRIVETVDIFPTILDVVGAKTSLRLDGRSLIDTRAARPATFVLRNRNRAPRPLGDLSADRAASLERKERRFGRGDVTALYARPSALHLLGMHVSRLPTRAAPDVQITVHNPTQFETVKRDRDPLPIYVRGVLTTSRSDPLSVAVVVNGTVAAIAESYQDRAGHMFGTLIPETTLREGHNTVAAFVVDGLPGKEP